jgi:hypothetical protein
VSDIHRYPSRPEGFEEPLFPTAAARRTVMEHFLKATWLMRASELKGKTEETAHALEEHVEIRDCGGRSYVMRSRGRRCSWRRRGVVEVLERGREVLVGTRVPTPKAVSASGAFLCAGRRGRRRAG